MAGRGSNTTTAQILFGLAPVNDPFCLGDGVSGYPDASGVTVRALHCANPEASLTRNAVEINAVSARAGVTTPIVTTYEAGFNCDVFVRSTDGEGFDFAEHDLFSLFLPVATTRTGRPTYSLGAWTTTTVDLDDEPAITVGEGFEITPATGGGTLPNRAYVRFASAVGVGSPNRLTFYPALPAAIVAVLNASAGAIGYGRTYAYGEEIARAGVAELRMQAFAKRIVGCVPATMTWNLTVGESATVRCETVAPYGERVEALPIGGTTEPPGSWLKLLNAEVLIADSTPIEARSVSFVFSHDPKRNVTHANAIGVSGMKRGSGGRVTASLSLSGYDLAQETLRAARSKPTLLATLGDGTKGNTVGIAIFAAGRTNVDEASEDDMQAQTVEFVADAYNGEGNGTYSGGVMNSIARVFFAGGE